MLNDYKTDNILVHTCIRECYRYIPPFIHGDIQKKIKS